MVYLIVILFCLGTLFLSSSFFIDAQILPKWYAMLYCMLGAGICYAIRFIVKPLSIRLDNQKIMKFVWIIVIFCTLQGLYGVVQSIDLLPVMGFRLTGSFDNPAGFAASLCAGFSLCLLFFELYKKKGPLLLALLCALILFLSIVLSGSRTGILSLILLCGIFLRKKIPIHSGLKTAILCIIILLSATGLYFIKKDSADGRMLIWQCSWNMFLDKPLLGHGVGGFETAYMDYQAAFFIENSDSKYAILADTVQHPFNEYIRIAVDYGTIGLLLLLLYVGFIVYCYLRYPNVYSRAALLCLISIAWFSFFSYPFMYPFVWFIFIVCSFAIIVNSGIIKLRISSILKKTLCVVSIGIFSFTIYQISARMQADIAWCKLTNRSHFLDSESLFFQYQSLHPLLKKDRYFLYNYSAVLHEKKKFEESLAIAKECRELWADYDLEMLIAENYNKLKQSYYAERHFELASRMCPNRFVPLYKMVLLYRTEQREEEAKILAEHIIEKDIKVQSNKIQNIKKEMEEFITNTNQQLK